MSSNPAEARTMEEFFGAAIHVYTRAQAIDDGVLIDISTTAREAGITFPVAITTAAWSDCVAWSEADSKRKRVPNDEAGRLWDLVWMLRCAARRAQGSLIRFEFLRVPREGTSRKPRLVQLKALCHPGDDGEAVITVMQPHED